MAQTTIRKILHLIHRSIYLLTAVFSREGIDRFLSKQVDEINRDLDTYHNILNVGSGGFVTRSIGRISSDRILNIDIDPERHPDLVVDACNMAVFENSSFDAVFMVEVLEHVQRPQQAISEVHRVLRDGGAFILTTPFIFEMHDRPHDYYRYTRHGLEFLLSDFSTVQISARNGYIDSIVVLCMRLFVSQYIRDKIAAIILMTLIFILYPAIWLMGRLVKSDAAASGFLVKCIK